MCFFKFTMVSEKIRRVEKYDRRVEIAVLVEKIDETLPNEMLNPT